ncbi:hypothetical protein BD847_2977 [Flavobacterium cutihirudinis]|uniref:TonB-dependent SusC/RagA subfamily outer membrane receptor n=1 Tax=Flavobacterium cutihirudinis TaxID=1265740 RepID=A0A3D9FVE1_9FLAO|nr:hypothetical protein [Flavobacterium cutihirudinis]RED23899.1 hypothetical protein BD847_2977 [Flavobacterium cutihirudinis]
MDNQDKIFNRFKEAADNAETKDFPGMEKIWSRVEEKLDKKEDKKTIALWKKIAIAASLLLLISLGAQFLKSDKTTIQNPKVVINETEKDATSNSVSESNNAVVSVDSPLVSKTEAIKILENQTKKKEHVAIQETLAPNTDFTPAAAEPQIAAETVMPVQAARAEVFEEEDNRTSKKTVTMDMGYSSSPQREAAKVAFADKSAQKAKKNVPLVVLNGNAMAHSDDVKKDKMMQNELPNLSPENVESLVILDEPLYIIDGIYYSENDLFGNNPTSPYAPLDKQDIKTITILQDLEATSKYGEKGKKGVVIITTKTGKPTPKK